MKRIIRHIDLDIFSIDNLYDFFESIEIQNVVISFQGRQFDIGSLAYAVRKVKSGKAIRDVELASYQVKRAIAITEWLKVHLEIVVSGKSGATFASKLRQLLVSLDNIDSMFGDSVFLSADTLNEAYQAHRIHISELRHPDGKTYSSIEAMLATWSRSMDIFCKALSYRKSPVQKIQPKGQRAEKPTLAPSEDAVAESLALSLSIFKGVLDLLESKSQYPMKLNLPRECVWLFPARQFCATEELLVSNKATLKRNVLWNYKLGRLNSLEEMVALSKFGGAEQSKNNYALRRERERALARLDESNSDYQCISRRQLMSLAQDAYVTLFTAATGMNESTLRELEYNPEWESADFQGEKKEVGFRGLKARARYKIVNFRIVASQLKWLKSFIRLRKMIAMGEDYSFLFIRFDVDERCVDLPIKPNSILGYYRRLNSFFYPGLKAISFRQLRKFKFEALNRDVGARISAQNLQHSEDTARNSYMGQSEDESRLQIARFIELYDQGLKGGGRLYAIKTPAGACVKPNNPELIAAVDTLKPDCHAYLGCLYCSNFLTHCTEGDIRKLISMRFFVENVLPLSNSFSVYQATGAKTIERLDELIEGVRSASQESADTVAMVMIEVYQYQALDSYWMSKLEFLSKLDLL